MAGCWIACGGSSGPSTGGTATTGSTTGAATTTGTTTGITTATTTGIATGVTTGQSTGTTSDGGLDGGSVDGATVDGGADGGGALDATLSDATPLDATQSTDSAAMPDSASGTDASTMTVGASVLEHHLHPTRDGAYTDAKVTTAAAGAIRMDTNFKPPAITGTIYGQPLYVDGWQTGVDAIFVATNQNHVTALNAMTGAILWDVTLGPPVAQTSLACGQPYTSYGVMETPVIDLSSRTLYTESFQTPDAGKTFKHYVFALSIDTGATKTGWPVDVAAKVTGFNASSQNDRGGLTILNGTVYVPYAGLNGDCSTYHGWVVGISTTNPAEVAAYNRR
jgi:hypothetical protein